MTNETIRTKFEYVDDDEPEDLRGHMRGTIERAMESEHSEEMIKRFYGDLGLEIYRELKATGN